VSKGGGVSAQTGETVITRDSGTCVTHFAVTKGYRAVPGEQIHHRRARGMGGSTDPEANLPANLIYVCAACHAFIESHRTWALEMGYLVRQGTRPSTVPIAYRHDVVYLTDDGSISQFVTTSST
jgi:5-methylcytosine-specific restriction protein A